MLRLPPTQGLDALLDVIESRNQALRRLSGSQHVERQQPLRQNVLGANFRQLLQSKMNPELPGSSS